MQDDLLIYYERELTYLRRLGAEFAQRYPKVASRLQLEPSKCEDPHVERLLEGFSFLAARVHRRLDDDFPEISEALLDILYPQHVRPLPAMSIVEMQLDPLQGKVPTGFTVPRGSTLRSRPVQGVPCQFRTSYDTTLWPITVAAAEWTSPDRAGGGLRIGDAVGAIRVEIRALPGMKLSDIELDSLRFHLAGEANVVDTLYELLANNCDRILVRDPSKPSRAAVTLDRSPLTPVGFGEHDGLLPYPPRMFSGFRLLQELFTFPQKFHFFDIEKLGPALRELGAGDRAELYFLVSSFERAERRQALELGMTARTFRTGCTPAVNLFKQSAEPILLTERSVEYAVVPDARRRLEIEVWSVDDVTLIEEGARGTTKLEPLYAHRHGRGTHGDGIFWHAARRASGWRTDLGTDVFLSFSDLSARMRTPDVEVVSLHLTCFNGDLPSRLQFGLEERGDFELSTGGPIAKITCVVNPTRVVQPPLGKPLLWRLISALSLNQFSLVDDGVEALRELLRLHNSDNALSSERQIEGLVAVNSSPAFARVNSGTGVAFARGRRVELEFDEEQFPGGGMFLFATVLERFLALYASMNSFTQVAVKSRQRRRTVRDWPARAGWRTLL